MTKPRDNDQDWNGTQYAQRSPDEETSDTEPKTDDQTRWNKNQWPGEDTEGDRPARQPREQMPEGEPGLSGDRHSPSAQDWDSSTSKR